MYRTSTDDGATWSAPVTIANDSGSSLNCNDPSIGLVDSGRLLVTYNKIDPATGSPRRLHRIYSDDSGASWSAEAQIWDPFALWCSGPGNPVLTSWGVVLKPVYGRHGADFYTSGVLRSTDNGATFGDFSAIAWPNSCAQGSPLAPGTARDWEEPSVIERPDGSLLASIRTDTVGETFTSVSVDRGYNWSSPKFSHYGWGAPAMTRLTNGAIICTNRQSDGTLPPDGDRRVIYTTSRDSGLSWETPAYLTADTGEMQYSDSVEVSANRAVVVWAVEHGAPFQKPADLYLSVLDDN